MSVVRNGTPATPIERATLAPRADRGNRTPRHLVRSRSLGQIGHVTEMRVAAQHLFGALPSPPLRPSSGMPSRHSARTGSDTSVERTDPIAALERRTPVTAAVMRAAAARVSGGGGVCPHCGAQVAGGFCSSCGQKAVRGRLDLHDLWQEFVRAVWDLDSGLVRLIRELATRPARVYASYLSGARTRYFNTVLFFLVAEGYYVAVDTWVFHREMAQPRWQQKLLAEQAALTIDEFKFRLGPSLVSVVSWLLFRRRYNLAETTVFWLFRTGFFVIVALPILPLRLTCPDARYAVKVVTGAVALLIMLWHMLAFVGKLRMVTVARCLALFFLTQVTFTYSAGLVYRAKGFTVDLGLIHTLRQSFGLPPTAP